MPQDPESLFNDPRTVNALRLSVRAARMSLTDAERQSLDQQILNQVKNWVAHLKPKSMALYLPFDGEPDLSPIAGWLNHRGIQLALPVVDIALQGQMHFHLWSENTPLQANRYGIDEPVNTPAINNPEIILAPLVAYSSTGTRLGMGGGYYDRWLGKTQPRPLLVGIAYELQRIEDLPRRDWDIPLDMVFTEKGRFSFAKPGK